VKRRGSQERDEADARAQAESRRERLLAELKAREEAGRQPPPAPPPSAPPPSKTIPPQAERSEADEGVTESDGDVPPEEGAA